MYTPFSHSSLIVLCLSRQQCQSGTEMVLRDRNVMDGLIWECPLRTCRKRWSIRAGSFFEDSKISLRQWLNIIYLWLIDVWNNQLSLMTEFLLRTMATTLAKIRQICSLRILHGNIELGGRGKTVESDKSMFGHKPKCNCCQVSEGA